MKFRMQRSDCQIVLDVPPRFHIDANEFKTVGLVTVDYKEEQLNLGYD